MYIRQLAICIWYFDKHETPSRFCLRSGPWLRQLQEDIAARGAVIATSGYQVLRAILRSDLLHNCFNVRICNFVVCRWYIPHRQWYKCPVVFKNYDTSHHFIMGTRGHKYANGLHYFIKHQTLQDGVNQTIRNCKIDCLGVWISLTVTWTAATNTCAV